MKAYNQTDLFRVLISAAQNGQLLPDAALLADYKEKRLQRAVKSLRSRNVFLYAEGSRTSVNLNDLSTIYTQPAGTKMIVVGVADNIRYGATLQSDNSLGTQALTFPQMHRLSVVGRDGRRLSMDLMPAQAGESGQPRYTSILLPVPFIIEPDEQIAIDLGYDTAMAAPGQTPYESFIIFCIKVSNRLTPQDEDAIAEVKRYIEAHNYQRGIFLNCETPNLNSVVFDTALAGGVAECETRPANDALLINGIGTTLQVSKIVIVDTADDYSFTLNQPARSSALNMPDFYQRSGIPNANASIAASPNYTKYFEFPVAHLLRPGAQLTVQVVNGGAAADADAVIDEQTGNVIMFRGVTA